MNLIEKATIRHYHKHRIAAYQRGTVEALGWKQGLWKVGWWHIEDIL